VKNPHKHAPYTNLNPNGRVPAPADNSDSSLFMVRGSLRYCSIVERYDKEPRYLSEVWEGALADRDFIPRFGQMVRPMYFHGGEIPTVIVKSTDEVPRVLGVLDVLPKDKEYLV
ncbi:unnamed protein product, partial [Tuber aestivum]